MKKSNHYDNLCAVAEHYGLEKQCTKTIEELDELRTELCTAHTVTQDLLAEIADVYNMLDQLCILLDREDEVQDIAESKMLRQLERIAAKQP